MKGAIVAGNWKMHKDLAGAKALAEQISQLTGRFPGSVQAIICVPAPFISVCREQADPRILVGAQNCHFEAEGAFTGEISSEMIRSAGATHCIVGHSERRHLFSENDEMIRRKVEALLHAKMVPVFCCGELLEEREQNKHFETIKHQLEKALFRLSEEEVSKVIVAYEPVWAIGTGETATPDQAQEMHAFIRKELAHRFGSDIANGMYLLYGGSCKPSNAAELFSCADVDGGLIGGASLEAESFVQIIQAAG